MGLELEYLAGQTPLDEDEKDGLRIQTITTREELDEFEQKNIEQAIQWTLGRKIKMDKVFSESFIKSLHKRMYDEVWSWAGCFRKSNKNIGVDKWKISTELKKSVDDAQFWIKNEAYGEDEIAVRFKHRIVSIHCFPNGNGRHSRLVGDIISDKIFNREVFTWGQSNLSQESDTRKTYLSALREADKGDFTKLLKFARS